MPPAAAPSPLRTLSLRHTAPGTPPWLADPDSWLSVADFARVYRRSTRTVQRWCQTGYLIEWGLPVYCDLSGRYWIRVEASLR